MVCWGSCINKLDYTVKRQFSQSSLSMSDLASCVRTSRYLRMNLESRPTLPVKNARLSIQTTCRPRAKSRLNQITTWSESAIKPGLKMVGENWTSSGCLNHCCIWLQPAVTSTTAILTGRRCSIFAILFANVGGQGSHNFLTNFAVPTSFRKKQIYENLCKYLKCI